MVTLLDLPAKSKMINNDASITKQGKLRFEHKLGNEYSSDEMLKLIMSFVMVATKAFSKSRKFIRTRCEKFHTPGTLL